MRSTGMRLDEETLERLRSLSPHEVLRAVTDAIHGAGPAGSEDFLEVFDQLIERGILTSEQVEAFGDLDR